ncbi:YIP1 family protein [Alteromonas oceanisediminis]|uniref:YIP1 family protein n=1 Tax=Alteromonas oceanisediminis TaxID=2836180 RepID=UPI001BD95ABD|nr:YIP1 family protein [Alteromonas oceanisediminis]MBT0584793.1 YIP1 family protein [Alteromonas oceanisediminis]
MSEVTNPIQACSEIFIKPNGVFAATNVKHNWSWFPFILVIALAILPAYLYFNFVDFEWYKDLIINSSYADTSPNEQAMIRNNMSAGSMQIFSVVGAFVGYIVINAIVATYLNLMTKSDEQSTHGFTDWYGFTWWISMPSVVAGLIALVVILLADSHQLSPVALSPTSLAYWFGLELGSPWFGLLQSMRIESLWSIYLIAVGLTQWTAIRGSKTYIIAAAPYLIIWGVWAAFTAFA